MPMNRNHESITRSNAKVVGNLPHCHLRVNHHGSQLVDMVGKKRKRFYVLVLGKESFFPKETLLILRHTYVFDKIKAETTEKVTPKCGKGFSQHLGDTLMCVIQVRGATVLP